MGRKDLAALVAALGPVIDAATPLVPDEVMARLEAAGIRKVPTGIGHGTVTAVLPGGPVEITTLRKDVSTDGRRATVAFSDDWREDAGRRDFTINALYADPASGKVSDWFEGLDDLAAGRVRFVGEPHERIREDHLRILRYYRFQARFGARLDKDAEKACVELAPMLKGLSRERVAWELLALLGLPDPVETVRRMHESGVLGVVLPEANGPATAALAALVRAEERAGIAPSPIRRLAALLPAAPRLVEPVAARLRLSAAQKRRLVTAAERSATPGDPRALAYRLGREAALDRLLLTDTDTAPLDDWDVPVLPLKGGEIVGRGVAAGPEVARILRAVEDRWIAEGFPSRERVDSLLDEELAGGPPS